jgi:hypothetical protein
MGIVLNGIGLYLDIVLVRLVGLYYHHFKSRFAWSWADRPWWLETKWLQLPAN